MTMLHLPHASLAGLVLVGLWSVPARASADLHICVQRIAGWEVDFTDAFQHGPIRIPAGTVFDFAGPAFGPASDPRDSSHDAKVGLGWDGITKEEADRRHERSMKDFDADKRHKPGIITLLEVTLTQDQPCADAPVAAVLAPDWNWTVSPVYGSSDTYFQTYGVVRGATFDTDFGTDADPLSFAAVRGEINGILQGTTERTVHLPTDP